MNRAKRPHADCGPWKPLRALRRQLAAQRNHPIYAARGNEQPLLQELVDRNPPVGGMERYIADLDRKESDCPPSSTAGGL